METQFLQDVLNNVGSIASIIGLLITLYIFYAVRRIKYVFLFNVRLPELIKELEEISESLSECVNESYSARLARSILLDAYATLRLMQQVTSGPSKREITRLRNEIWKYKLKQYTPDQADASLIRDKMNMIIRDLNNVLENSRLTAR